MKNKNYKETGTHFGLMVFIGLVFLALVAAYFYFMPTYRSFLTVSVSSKDTNGIDLLISEKNLSGALERLDLSKYTSRNGIKYDALRKSGELKPKVFYSTDKSNGIRLTVVDQDVNFAYDYVNAIVENLKFSIGQSADSQKNETQKNIENRISENEKKLEAYRAELAGLKTSSTISKAETETIAKEITNLEKEIEPNAEQIEKLRTSIPEYFTMIAKKDEGIVKAVDDYKTQLKQYVLLYVKDSSASMEGLSEKEKAIRNACYILTASDEVTDILTQYLTLSSKSEAVEAIIADRKARLSEYENNEIAIQKLQADISACEGIISSLKQKSEESELSEKQTVSVEIQTPAKHDDSLFSTDRIIAGLAGFIAGALLGLFLGIGKDSSNDTITRDSVIRDILGHSFDCLGWIPYEKSYNTIKKYDSNAFARYRILANNLSQLLQGCDKKVLAFYSTGLQEGVTTEIVNLATHLAMNGKKVLVIDGNFRHPDLENAFCVEKPRYGLSDVVTKVVKKENTIFIPVGNLPDLHMMTAGKRINNVNFIFNSENFTALLNECRSLYDFVFIDCCRKDFVMLSSECDAYILNVRAGVTTVSALEDFNIEKGSVKIPMLGYVFYGKIMSSKATESGFKAYKKALYGEDAPKIKDRRTAEPAYNSIIEEEETDLETEDTDSELPE